MTVEHLLSGEGEPFFTPPSLAAHYIDTLTGQEYRSIGTGSYYDWKRLAAGQCQTVSGAIEHNVSAGVSHVIVRFEAWSGAATLNVDNLTHSRSGNEDGGATVLDIEVVQAGSDVAGSLFIRPSNTSAAPQVINGAAIDATVDGTDVAIPGRAAPWSALLRLSITGGRMRVYVLATDVTS